jgi:hypothetical protein
LKFSGFQGALLRQRSAKVASETPNAATNRIWRPPNRELSDRGRGLLVEPLANHQRESPEQGIECGSITLGTTRKSYVKVRNIKVEHGMRQLAQAFEACPGSVQLPEQPKLVN